MNSTLKKGSNTLHGITIETKVPSLEENNSIKTENHTDNNYAQNQRAQFEKDGYLVVKGFATEDECNELKQEMEKLINEWDGTCHSSFRTDEKQVDAGHGKNDYFFESANKIHFFLEVGAIDEQPDGTTKIKPGISKHMALNKVGHGLHVHNPVFHNYAHSSKVVNLTHMLGWQQPVLPQSMYIFKNPGIGGEVTSHQDSGFLYTTPRPTCLGLWLALHDATEDNGCLWARPGSHHEPLRRKFVRNPEYFVHGNTQAPKMIFEHLTAKEGETATQEEWYDGRSMHSQGIDPRTWGFVPVPIQAGDLFVIHGSLDHLSLPNLSQTKRETFQLHLIEGPSQGITWSDSNWLQYPHGESFPLLREKSRR